MDPSGGTNDGRRAASDALIVFLGTATLCLLGLLLAVRFQPAWFGLAVETTPDAAPTAPLLPIRPEEPKGLGAELSPRPVVPRAPSAPTLAQAIFDDAQPSVVHVTKRSRRDPRMRTQEYVSGTGSGVIWDTDGHVVTCLHVLENVSSAFVTLSDGTEWEARYVGRDEQNDLAVLRIGAPTSALTPIRVGTSGDLRVGQRLYSVACPYGIGHSLSVGYVSGLGRSIRSISGKFIDGVIQTDAAMHPGSSGGALVDDQGRVVGLNAAIHLGSRSQAGVGFAQPVDRLQEIVPRIIANGFRWYTEFGFTIQPDVDAQALLASLAASSGAPTRGVVVAQVIEDSAAARSGLRPMLEGPLPGGGTRLQVRDVIVGASERPVEIRADLEEAIAALEPGAELVLQLARRDGVVELAIPAPSR
ncbi:MAG: trypsin-like peptidase domain-containing protein [Planctomycetota bacterium]